ncbi:uncharacterized protein BYT42DRAFT_377984 [Radiomyces spectabilis]|uniref:uncharacterized protein n=1 Tax=Radiomyces spectabilis TaxID=64574 RepID=UPI0022201445|nr:uncharacterized protein BYT42DRAFT_377984 [Radiomyces spectabilis]KAI8376195.1 hypothetical protein BYT42DRAFT_377984 [Radiomyces spectabilis]
MAQSARDDLRAFYHSSAERKLKRFIRLQTTRRYTKTVQEESSYIVGQQSGYDLQGIKKLPVRMIDVMGTGVGPRIGGHARCGGKWHKKLASRYNPVTMTNEHQTSQRCVFCYQKIVHPKKTFIKDGKQVQRTVNGSATCINSKCIARLNGFSTFPRDAMSAVAICLAGRTTMEFGRPLATFDPSRTKEISQSYAEAQEALETRPNVQRLRPEGTHG